MQWEEWLVDLFGNEQQLMNEYINDIMKDDNLSQVVKDWLKQSLR